jgi:hypothetical protein
MFLSLVPYDNRDVLNTTNLPAAKSHTTYTFLSSRTAAVFIKFKPSETLNTRTMVGCLAALLAFAAAFKAVHESLAALPALFAALPTMVACLCIQIPCHEDALIQMQTLSAPL